MPADLLHACCSCKKSRRLAEQWLVFEVADTGCGIAPEGLQSLFQQFVQVGMPSLADTYHSNHRT